MSALFPAPDGGAKNSPDADADADANPDPATDVVVIGGGPIGIATAIGASLAGMSVTVLEPKRGDIDKACGEGLMPGALAALARLGVHPPGADMRGIAYTDGTHYATADFPGLPGRGVRRVTLHRCLSARAQTLGVTFVSASMRAMEQDDGGVTIGLGTAAAALRARYAVGADGLHSRTRRVAGLERAAGSTPRRRFTRQRRFGYRQHFARAPWTDRVEVYWGRRAEVYVTPVAADTVAVAVLTNTNGSFADHVRDFPDLMARIEGAEPSSTLRGAGPLRQSVRARANGRILLVGDAGGYVDALTGEGLAVGLAQASAAVEALNADAPGRYPRLARRASWRSTTLTSGLLYASRVPAARAAIVPASARLPWAFRWAVGELAAT